MTFYVCKKCGWEGEVNGRPRCLPCYRKAVAEWRAKNPEKVRAQKRRQDKRMRRERREEYNRRRRKYRKSETNRLEFPTLRGPHRKPYLASTNNLADAIDKAEGGGE